MNTNPGPQLPGPPGGGPPVGGPPVGGPPVGGPPVGGPPVGGPPVGGPPVGGPPVGGPPVGGPPGGPVRPPQGAGPPGGVPPGPGPGPQNPGAPIPPVTIPDTSKLPFCQPWQPSAQVLGAQMPPFFIYGCVQSANGFICDSSAQPSQSPTCNIPNWNNGCVKQPYGVPLPPAAGGTPTSLQLWGCTGPTNNLQQLRCRADSATTDPARRGPVGADIQCLSAPPPNTASPEPSPTEDVDKASSGSHSHYIDGSTITLTYFVSLLTVVTSLLGFMY